MAYPNQYWERRRSMYVTYPSVTIPGMIYRVVPGGFTLD